MKADNEKKWAKAKSLYEKGDMQTALPIFEELYGQEDDPQLIISYARILQQLKQYVQAAKVAQNNYVIFVEKAPQLFVEIMLANDRPLDARLFIKQLPLKQQETLQKKVEKAEKQLSIDKHASIRELSRSFSHLGDFSFSEQQIRFNQASGLPLREYLLAAKFVLRDPYVYPLIKSSIVKDLISLDVDETMTMYWIDDQEHNFNPKEVLAFDQIQQVNEVFRLLNQAYLQEDPQSLQIYSQTFNLQLLFLYPFVTGVIKDAHAWFRALIGQTDPNNSADKQALYWQKLIEKLATNLA